MQPWKVNIEQRQKKELTGRSNIIQRNAHK